MGTISQMHFKQGSSVGLMKAFGERTILEGLICPHYSILNLDGLSPSRGSPVKTTSQLPLSAYDIGDVTLT